MAWMYLFVAVFAEIAWATSLKATAGLTKLGPTLFNFAAALAGIYLLSMAMKSLPTGTAYAVWTGLGAVGVTILGIVLYHESIDAVRIGCIALIILGVVGLRFFSAA
ncbi:QacE family quaternary ammonium compound efflux SMR transporter [Candidatus Peregrinibacteria bacterium CG10_big_fil_rev_8_21_14_0_10_55_24]|nr:MAG: QacE family quaternary ammonium compound efflux SMR transporter [Candidatus Peregrinibacteria bacterium CG10_big_fil_rev_8_21_14_0_10_55_24]